MADQHLVGCRQGGAQGAQEGADGLGLVAHRDDHRVARGRGALTGAPRAGRCRAAPGDDEGPEAAPEPDGLEDPVGEVEERETGLESARSDRAVGDAGLAALADALEAGPGERPAQAAGGERALVGADAGADVEGAPRIAEERHRGVVGVGVEGEDHPARAEHARGFAQRPGEIAEMVEDAREGDDGGVPSARGRRRASPRSQVATPAFSASDCRAAWERPTSDRSSPR